MMLLPFFLKNPEKKDVNNTAHNIVQMTNVQTYRASFTGMLAEMSYHKNTSCPLGI